MFTLQIRHILFSIALIILISACTSNETPTDVPTATPTSEPVLASRPVDRQNPTETAPPPPYREPIAPMNLENVMDIEYLGRLDAPGRKSTIFNWALSPDGTQLITLNNDLLMEWNLVTGELNFNTSRRNVTNIFYSRDKNEIYGINPDGKLLIYRSITGDELTSVTIHNNYSGIIHYHPITGYLAVAGTDGTIKVWDMSERLSLVTIEAHDDILVDITFSSDGQRLASTGSDGIIKIWDWKSKSLLQEYDLQDTVAEDMVFSPDDSQLAVSTKNFVALWSTISNELDFVLQSGTDTANEVLKFSPDGTLLLTAGQAGNMRLWNTETANLEIELPDIGGNRTDGVFSPDSTLLATSLLGGNASLWNLTNITEKTVARAPLDVESNNLFGVEWSNDGYSLIFFDATGEIYVWGIPSSDG